MTIEIAGRVIDRVTGHSDSGLRVEAWACSSTSAHQSRVTPGVHQHYFEAAHPPLTVQPTDVLVAYVYLDPENPPREVMLQWNNGSWEHRAYWGENAIRWGLDGSPSRRFIGPLPPVGRWVRLEVPARSVGLEERAIIHGISFTLFDGRATWDHAGKAASPGASPDEDDVWVEDAVPDGATTGGNEPWEWVEEDPLPFSAPGGNLVGGAGAAEDGTFRIVIEEDRLAAIFQGHRPHLYFRVLRADGILISTENSLVWSPGDAPDGILIPVELPDVPPQPATYELVCRLVDRESRAPLGGLAVRASLPIERGGRELGTAIADEQGYIAIRHTLPEETRPGEPVTLQLQTFTREGAHIQRMDVRVRAGQGEVVEVLVSSPEAPSTAELPLPALAESLSVELDPELVAFLEERDIRDLAGIRGASGIHHLEGLPVPPDGSLVRLLEAHAQLSVLPTEPALNSQLIEAGFTNLVEIARTPLRSFMASTARAVGSERQAAAIHAAASTQFHLLGNVLTELRVNGDSGTLGVGATLRDLLSPNCSCDECQNATGQLAYLADLLDYAVRHLKQNTNPITLTFLEDRFHQPFRRLPASCAALEQPLRQVRICIEVLRGYLPPNLRSYTPPWYLDAVYHNLLEQHGTSFDEIRRARGLGPDERLAIGRRLMLPVETDPAHHDVLDFLFSDPAQVTEQWLHDLFGLRDTTLDPLQPDPTPCLERSRRKYLRERWKEQDWPASPPPETRPVIDPDVIGVPDIRDPSLTNPIYKRWKDRRQWVQSVTEDIHAFRTDPNIGLDALLRDGQYGLGSSFGSSDGPGVADIMTLRRRWQRGGEIGADLTRFRLSLEAFDHLSAVVELDASGATVLDSEWQDVYSILIQRIKVRDRFPLWRKEERDEAVALPSIQQPSWMGIELSPDHFQLRPPEASMPDWRPTPWRSTWEARWQWEDTLKARLQQDHAVSEDIAAAVDATEEYLLGKLRDGLLGIAVLLDPLAPKKVKFFTDHLQIDVESDTCQLTTRVAQAIETLQGILFGARHGLLEDQSLMLDAVEFDEAWKWLGSYEAWRSAMLIFLYPEDALRPTLREPKSPEFEAMVERMRSVGRIAPDDADALAADYTSYFADVVSLGEAALYDSARPLDPKTARELNGEQARYVLAFARAGNSGKHYYSQYRLRVKPSQYPGLPPVQGGAQVESYWTAVPTLPEDGEIVGMLPYQPASGVLHLGLYARVRVDGDEEVTFTSYDGTAWSEAAKLPALPPVVRAAQADAGALAPNPDAAAGGVAAAEFQGDEHLVAADIDGDGSTEILAFAAPPGPNGRRVAVLREWAGGLATAWTGTLPAGWRLPDWGRPVILRAALKIYPWSADRLLVINDSAARIGILGWQPGAGLVLLWSSADPGGWPVTLFNDQGGVSHPTTFVAANVDGFGVRVLAFEHRASGHNFSPVKTTVTVLDWVNDLLVFRTTHDLEFHIDADRSLATHSVDYDIRWERFVPVRSGFAPGGFDGTPREDILVLSARTERVTAYLSEPNKYETHFYLQLLRWDSPSDRFRAGNNFPWGTIYINVVPGAAGQNDWTLSGDEQFLAIIPSALRTRPDILVRSPSRSATGVLRYRSDGSLETIWQASGTIPGPGNPALDWPLQAGDRFLAADVNGDGAQELLIAGQDGQRLGLVVEREDGGLTAQWIAMGQVPSPDPASTQVWRLTSTGDTGYSVADLNGDGQAEVVILTRERRLGVLRGVPRPKISVSGLLPPLQPQGVTVLKIGNQYTGQELATRRAEVQAAYAANPPQHLVYLDEAYYFVPIELGLRLREGGYYAEALDWFRTVYDYARPGAQRKVPSLLIWEETLPDEVERSTNWIVDTLNPHRIAATRPHTYTRFTLLAIIQCLLEFGDAEFSRNTPESRARARELYLTALDLLDSPEFNDTSQICRDLIAGLTIQVGEDEERWVWKEIGRELGKITRPAELADAVNRVRAILTADEPLWERYQAARELVAAIQAKQPEPLSFEATLAHSRTALTQASLDLLADASLARQTEQAGLVAAGGRLSVTSSPPSPLPETPLPPWPDLDDGAMLPGPIAHLFKLEREIVSAPRFGFCVAPNPALQIARRWAESNLFKIRTCRDIAGMHQSDERRPTQYRFGVLIERTKELVRLAGQVESAMLAALERRDQEYYTLLQAQQEMQVANAVVQLQSLRVFAANHQVTLTTLQQERAQLQETELTKWIEDGLNEYEQTMIRAYQTIARLEIEGVTGDTLGNIFSSFFTTAIRSPVGAIQWFAESVASGMEMTRQIQLIQARTSAQVSVIHASHERQKDEWILARQVAKQDALIAGTQILAALDTVGIEQREHVIAGMRTANAEAMVAFLSRKFTSYDLYDWMSGVLEHIHRFFLQQATAAAQAAAHQLAFERQEPLTSFIQHDYWLPPSTGGDDRDQSQDRRGLTGSARLTQDLYQLDQYAFQTNRQKQQLVKVVSLSQLDPYAFEQFRRSGLLRFTTPGELFDRDFPGHYLRLIRRVRTSVIALVPPTHGIRAVLTTSGISRVVVPDEGDYRTVVVRRNPESVALSSPINATGLFELEVQSDMPFPFEWMGVDTAWELRMPKASNSFDYNTLADVLLTVEYTALDSSTYRRQVIEQLAGRPLFADRPFSFRHEFADAWYDLNNADPSASNITVTWETRREDFPPNLEDVKVERVLLNFSYAPGRSFTVPVDQLTFIPGEGSPIAGGPGASDQQGTISSRNGGGADGWREFKEKSKTVSGKWELTLPNDQQVRNRFKNEDVENVLFVITYSGRTPAWPA